MGTGGHQRKKKQREPQPLTDASLNKLRKEKGLPKLKKDKIDPANLTVRQAKKLKIRLAIQQGKTPSGAAAKKGADLAAAAAAVALAKKQKKLVASTSDAWEDAESDNEDDDVLDDDLEGFEDDIVEKVEEDQWEEDEEELPPAKKSKAANGKSVSKETITPVTTNGADKGKKNQKGKIDPKVLQEELKKENITVSKKLAKKIGIV